MGRLKTWLGAIFLAVALWLSHEYRMEKEKLQGRITDLEDDLRMTQEGDLVVRSAILRAASKAQVLLERLNTDMLKQAPEIWSELDDAINLASQNGWRVR